MERMLCDPNHKPLADLALEMGFSSLSAYQVAYDRFVSPE
jgi:hypothetical protein